MLFDRRISMKKVKDLKWGIEYDFDEVTQMVSLVLTCYHSNGTTTSERFEYEYSPERFSEPYDSELDKVLEQI